MQISRPRAVAQCSAISGRYSPDCAQRAAPILGLGIRAPPEAATAMHLTRQLVVLAISGVACVAWIGLFRSLAARLGLLDHPGGRKRHDVAVPVVGGLAMFLGMLPVLFAGGHGALVNLGLAMLLVVVVGAADDKVSVSARTRLLLEGMAALILVAGGASLRHLGNLVGLGALGTSLAAPLITVICVVGTINAVNMSDGLDGLAGAVGFVAVACFTAVAFASGEAQLVKVGCAALGALAGFLAFNLRTRFRSRAAVFMGDAGSMLLGLFCSRGSRSISRASGRRC